MDELIEKNSDLFVSFKMPDIYWGSWPKKMLTNNNCLGVNYGQHVIGPRLPSQFHPNGKDYGETGLFEKWQEKSRQKESGRKKNN